MKKTQKEKDLWVLTKQKLDLLSYLDLIKPLLLEKLDIIKYSLEYYENLKTKNILGDSSIINFALDRSESRNDEYSIDKPNIKNDLGIYETSLEFCLEFFPNASRKSIKIIIDLLSFERPLLGRRVFLLDVLSIIVLLLKGELHDRAKFLFDWYNINGSGFMSELEHYTMINRICTCLNRMRVIGAIEFTREDARLSAFKARVRKNGDEMYLLRGMNFEDFFNWCKVSDESQAIFSFFRIFQQLVDTMIGLNVKAEALRQLVEERENIGKYDFNVPRMDIFQLQDHKSPVLLTYLGRKTISICLSSSQNLDSEMYILCQKIKTVPNPFYTLPSSINSKLKKDRETKSSDIDIDKCCDKMYVLESYQRCYLDKISTRKSLIRVDVRNLEPNSRYIFRIYSSKWRYQPIEVKTITEMEIRNQFKMCILPASLSIPDAKSFIDSTPGASNIDMIVYTGTICPLDKLFRQMLLFSRTDQISSPLNFSASFYANADTIYKIEWIRHVQELLNLSCSLTSPSTTGEFSAYNTRQLFIHSGMGPWSNPGFREQVKSSADPNLFALLQYRLENLYAEYTKALNPSISEWLHNPYEIIFLQSSLEVDTSKDDVKSMYGLSIEKLIEKFQAFDENSRTEHVILIMRSPFDLLSSKDFSNSNDSLPSKVQFTETNLDTNLMGQTAEQLEIHLSRKDSAPVKLRGKHEIIHGEYKKDNENTLPTPLPSDPQNNLKSDKRRLEFQASFNDDVQKDDQFCALIQAMFAWLRTEKDNMKKQVTFVSTGWFNGYNFDILSTLPHEEEVLINHVNLLPTKKKMFDVSNLMDLNDALISRIQMSLPQINLVLSMTAPTDLRSLVFGGGSNSKIQYQDGLLFLPINKIEDKSVNPLLGNSLSPIRIFNGPRILKLTCSSALVAVDAQGYGMVKCILYELPMFLNYVNSVALIDSERDQLIEVETILKRCTGPGDLLFRFVNLKNNSCYCIYLENSNILPLVANFRTLQSPLSTISSVIVAAVTESDYALPSFALSKVKSLLSGERPRTYPVHLIHYPIEKSRHKIGPSQPGMVDINYLYRMSNVVHVLRDQAHPIRQNQYSSRMWFDEINSQWIKKYAQGEIDISLNGKFCRLSPRDGSVGSLRKVIDAIRLVDTKSSIDHITLFLQKPIIRYLQCSKSKWICDGYMAEAKYDCIELISTLLDWKAKELKRDCVVVGLANIPSIKVATIRYGSAVKDQSSSVKELSIHEESKAIGNSTESLVRAPDGPAVSIDDNSIGEASDDLGEGSITIGSIGELEEGASENTSVKFAMKSSSQLLFESRVITIRQVILPLYIREKAEKPQVVYPKGKCYCDVLEYEISDIRTEHKVNVVNPRYDLYPSVIPITSIEPGVYVVDIVASFGAEFLTGRSVGSDEMSSVASELPIEEKLAYHTIVVRNILHDMDLLEIVAGPIIGLVTQDTATVSLEVNRKLRFLECRLRPRANPKEGVLILKKEKVKPFSIVTFKFEGLQGGQLYDILVPAISGRRSLGIVRTFRSSVPSAQIVITGESPLDNIELIKRIAESIRDQQSPELNSLRTLTDYMFNKEIAFDGLHLSDTSYYTSALQQPSQGNTWAWLSEHFRFPCSSSSLVVHLGSQSLLTTKISLILDALIEHGKKLFLPLRDASAVKAWYFNQFEEVIKDTFRLLFAINPVKDALSIGSHLPVYHSEYLIPLPRNMSLPAEDKSVLAIIRKVYETHFPSYIAAMYNWNPEDKSHAKLYRNGSMIVVILDIVSERKKLKKFGSTVVDSKTMSQEDIAKAQAAQAAAEDYALKHPYSAGFLDLHQMKFLREASADKTATHLIICTEKPFIPLGDISKTYEEPDNIPKGETVPWGPTVDDLQKFFDFLIKWIRPNKDAPNTNRHVALLSTASIPYVTTVMDIVTGLKVQQLCIGKFNKDQSNPSTSPIDKKDIVFSGKIGKMRYFHKFKGFDGVTIDSSRDSIGGDIIDLNVDISKIDKVGFAILKVWFDTWKAVGQWSVISSRASRKNPNEDALILAGPILGVPYLYETPIGPKFMIPLLVEVDRKADIVLQAVNTFSTSITEWTIQAKAKRAIVFVLGPLDIECRYNCKFSKGVSGNYDFVISTHFDFNEANIAVINCKSDQVSNPCADFLKDLVKRVKVPFSGVTAVLHLNVVPNLKDVLDELRSLPELKRALQKTYKDKKLHPDVFHLLEDVFDHIRQAFRSWIARPSYRELLRNSFNISMINDPIPPREAMNNNQIMRMLNLMVARTSQEYYDLLLFPSVNVFRAMKPASEELLLHFTHGPFNLDDDFDMYEEDEEYEDADYNENDLDPVDPEALEMEAIDPNDLLSDADDDDNARQSKRALRARKEEYEFKKSQPKPPKKIPSPFMFSMINKLSENYNKDPKFWNRLEIPSGSYISPSRPSTKGGSRPSTKQSSRPGTKGSSRKKGSRPGTKQGSRPASKYNLKSTEDEDDEPQIPQNTIEFSDPSKHPVEAVFDQWISFYFPAPAEWRPWITPNGKVSIEKIPNLQTNSLETIHKIIDDSPIDKGGRIIIMEEGSQGRSLGLLKNEEMEIGASIQRGIWRWVGESTERNILLLCPSSSVGTKFFEVSYKVNESIPVTVPDKFKKPLKLFLLDSIYRSNEFDREAEANTKDEEVRQAAKDKKKKKQGGGKSKAAKLKRQEEERQLKLKAEAELQALLANLVPDGYIIYESRSVSITARNGQVFNFENFEGKLFPSVRGGSAVEEEMYQDPDSRRPSPGDYIQLPEWLSKFSPNPESLFAQDEVILNMRQDRDSKEVLAIIEGETMFSKIRQMYERSRLSELSRPPDLREVELDAPGVLSLFVKDLIERIWLEIVPDDIKPKCVSLCDDFIRVYCLSKAMPDSTMLESGETFAKCIQYALVLSMSLKSMIVMSKLEKWNFIMKEPDRATARVRGIMAREFRMMKFHERAINTGVYNKEQVQADFEAQEEKLAAKDDEESDIEELNKEDEERQKRLEEEFDNADDDDDDDVDDDDDDDGEGGEKGGEDGEPKPTLTEAELEEELKRRDDMGKEIPNIIMENMKDEIILEAIKILSQEQMKAEDEAEEARLSAGPVLTPEERLAETIKTMEFFEKERRKAKRNLYDNIQFYL